MSTLLFFLAVLWERAWELAAILFIGIDQISFLILLHKKIESDPIRSKLIPPF